jgi:hypothetical protein
MWRACLLLGANLNCATLGTYFSPGIAIFVEDWSFSLWKEVEMMCHSLFCSIDNKLELSFEPDNTTLVGMTLPINVCKFSAVDRALFKTAVGTFTIFAMVSAECQVSATRPSLRKRSTASTISFCYADIVVEVDAVSCGRCCR